MEETLNKNNEKLNKKLGDNNKNIESLKEELKEDSQKNIESLKDDLNKKLDYTARKWRRK